MRTFTVYVTRVKNKTDGTTIEFRWANYKVAINFVDSLFEEAINSDEMLVEFYSEQIDTGEPQGEMDGGDDDW